ncbi:MAG: guanitoxin biosynthesis MBL fold metallo-hydrolase GntH, partial [Sphingomonadales bacterium]
MRTIKLAFLGTVVALMAGLAFTFSGPAIPAGGPVSDPTGTAPDRYVYYPGTEALEEGEIRIIACGSGMPDQRPAQASACFLFELGNGDKFIFDIGSGSMRNIASLMIPYEFLTKVFLSHLHTDHWGDLNSLWAGGWTAGRPVPLEIWGPSGATEDMGTAYAIARFLEANNWDKTTRNFKITPIPGQIIVHEFDYKQVNEVVYQENGVTIRSIPAIHAGDGPVSFILEYAGLKVIFAGDTAPNKWFVEYAKDADVVIHEAFNPPSAGVILGNQPPQLAWRLCCEFHTSGPS